MISCFGILFSQQKVMIKPVNNVSGYEISIKTENLQGKTIKLSIYNGNFKTVFKIDSVTVKNNSETVFFRQKKNVISAIYQLAISGKSQKKDILVNNGDKINFKLNEIDIEKLQTENALNKSFFEYQKMNIGEEKNQFLVNLQKKYPKLNALKIFTLFETRKSLKIAPNQSVNDFRSQLLKDIDVNDKTIALMPNSFSFLNTYFTSGDINSENYKAGIDSFFKNQKCENNNFKFYVNWIFRNVELLQTKNINDVPDYFFNKYINNKTCIEKDKNFYDASLKKVQTYTKNPVGSTLQNFELQTIDNKEFSLNNFVKEKINLIVFYDPSCEHCKVEIPKITQEISDLEKESNKKVGKIAVLNTFSKKDWKEFIEKSKLESWTNITYKDGDTKTQAQLDVYNNPSFFIIDEKGKILLKVYSLSFIRNFISEQK